MPFGALWMQIWLSISGSSHLDFLCSTLAAVPHTQQAIGSHMKWAVAYKSTILLMIWKQSRAAVWIWATGVTLKRFKVNAGDRSGWRGCSRIAICNEIGRVSMIIHYCLWMTCIIVWWCLSLCAWLHACCSVWFKDASSHHFSKTQIIEVLCPAESIVVRQRTWNHGHWSWLPYLTSITGRAVPVLEIEYRQLDFADGLLVWSFFVSLG